VYPSTKSDHKSNHIKKAIKEDNIKSELNHSTTKLLNSKKKERKLDYLFGANAPTHFSRRQMSFKEFRTSFS